MGNYISCTFIVPTIRTFKAARVIFPGGEIRHLREPVKAAELMLESPNFFLVNSKSLNIGRRFAALSADEDVEFGNVYIMFPMRRVNSIVTPADMAAFFMSASSASKRISNGKVRVIPEVVTPVTESAESEVQNERSILSLDEIEGFELSEFRFRLASCRSRKPTLDTITEEPLYSR
jgi:hypothetical protein